MAELKKCPFCGGTASTRWTGGTTRHFIQCDHCGSRSAINVASHGGSAADDWNRRAISAAEAVQALEEAYIRGATWYRQNEGCNFNLLRKAAQDYADYQTSPAAPADGGKP